MENEVRLPTAAEDAQLFEQEKLDRVASIKLATQLGDEEQQRRIDEVQKQRNLDDLERQKNMADAIATMDDEAARVEAEEIAKLAKEELLKKANVRLAISLAEEEGQRRIQQAEDQHLMDERERLKNQATALKVMDTERERQLSEADAMPRLPSPIFVATKAKENSLTPAVDTVDVKLVACAKKTEQNSMVDQIEVSLDENASSEIASPREEGGLVLPIESDQPEVELQALAEFRKLVKFQLADAPQFEELVGNIRLLRFLRGMRFNVPLAVEKYKAMLKWRKENNIDEIRQNIVKNNLTTETFPGYQKISQYLPFVNWYDTVDKAGNVLFYERTGYADSNGILQNVSDEEWDVFYIYEMEYRAIQLDMKSRTSGKLVRNTIIRDLEGLSVTNISATLLGRVQRILDVSSKYYPETASSVHLVNAPWIFNTVWKGIKLWFNAHQLKKISLMGNEYQASLREVVDLSSLPPELGGTNDTLNVPKSGLMLRSSFDRLLDCGGISTEVRRGTIHQLPFNISKGDTISWELEVRALDIDFVVNFRTQGDGGAIETTVVDKTRIKMGKMHSGSWQATENGKVVILFNNKYSWTKHKEVAYKTSMVKAIL